MTENWVEESFANEIKDFKLIVISAIVRRLMTLTGLKTASSARNGAPTRPFYELALEGEK